jgi:hypothetical protein
MGRTYPKTPSPTTLSGLDAQTVFQRAFKTDQTTDAITMGVPTATEPAVTTDGVHVLGRGKQVLVLPYGRDTRNDEFRLAIELWFPMYDMTSQYNESSDVIWLPFTAALLDIEIQDALKAAGSIGPITTDDYFGIVQAIASGTTQSLVTAGEDFIADDGDVPTTYGGMSHIRILTLGATYIQFHIDINGGAGTAATQGNAMYAVI